MGYITFIAIEIIQRCCHAKIAITSLYTRHYHLYIYTTYIYIYIYYNIVGVSVSHTNSTYLYTRLYSWLLHITRRYQQDTLYTGTVQIHLDRCQESRIHNVRGPYQSKNLHHRKLEDNNDNIAIIMLVYGNSNRMSRESYECTVYYLFLTGGRVHQNIHMDKPHFFKYMDKIVHFSQWDQLNYVINCRRRSSNLSHTCTWRCLARDCDFPVVHFCQIVLRPIPHHYSVRCSLIAMPMQHDIVAPSHISV